jgi:hypothetical protein
MYFKQVKQQLKLPNLKKIHMYCRKRKMQHIILSHKKGKISNPKSMIHV